MSGNCAYCSLNTAGQHEPKCPLWKGYVNVLTYTPEIQQPTERDIVPLDPRLTPTEARLVEAMRHTPHHLYVIGSGHCDCLYKKCEPCSALSAFLAERAEPPHKPTCLRTSVVPCTCEPFRDPRSRYDGPCSPESCDGGPDHEGAVRTFADYQHDYPCTCESCFRLVRDERDRLRARVDALEGALRHAS